MKQKISPNQCLAWLALALAGALIARPAMSGGDHNHSHGTIAEDSRFSNNSPGATWPPQPRGRSAEQRYTPTPANATATTGGQPNKSPASPSVGSSQSNRATKQARVGSARTSAKIKASANAHVRNLLGERYAHIATRALNRKWDRGSELPQFEVIFFSHSHNQTVSVRVDGGELEQVSTTSAAIAQPPLAQVEMDQAVSMARQWWQQRGQSRVDQLAGFAIQTYQNNGAFHPQRMIYVSFHESSEMLPELLTWVDLTSQKIIRAQVSQ